jgi:hypothetical protein
MSPDEFEQQLQRQPLRPVPAEWRAAILGAAKAAMSAPDAPRPTPSFLSAVNDKLSSVFWPNPQAWAGLAAVWLVLLLVNFSSAKKTAVIATISPPPSPEMMLVLREQRRELARLVEPLEEPAAEPPKAFFPRPRGERQTALIAV